jgi:enediyne biosynthesis protein E7
MSAPVAVAPRPTRPMPRPPRTQTLPLLLRLFRNRLEVMEYVTSRYGDVVRLPLGPKTLHVFNKPDYARHVLADHAANYEKGIGQVHARRVMGNGLLTSDGELWRKQRTTIKPVFQARRISGQLAAIAEEAEHLVVRMRERVGGGPLDIRDELTGLALGVLGRTLIDADLSAFESLGHSFEAVQDQALFEVMTLGAVPLWVPLPRQMRFRRAKRELQVIVDQLAADARVRPDGDDVTSRLLDSIKDETDPKVGRTRMRDELLTLLLAGHETTASTMSWAFYLLDQHPEMWERVHDEAVRVFSSGPLTTESLHRLTYTTMVLRETLRLYPPVWLLPRIAKEADQIGEYRVPARADVLICPYLLHRHPDYWPDPERFDPERFAPDNTDSRDTYAYLPFGAGPRFCVGNSLGLMEATVVLAAVARDLRLKKLPAYQVIAEPMLTLRARGGLPMTVHPID